ncbi:hypothetical protein Plhal304r1_c065g0152681 [Plasmopara halstedii]
MHEQHMQSATLILDNINLQLMSWGGSVQFLIHSTVSIYDDVAKEMHGNVRLVNSIKGCVNAVSLHSS